MSTLNLDRRLEIQRQIESIHNRREHKPRPIRQRPGRRRLRDLLPGGAPSPIRLPDMVLIISLLRCPSARLAVLCVNFVPNCELFRRFLFCSRGSPALVPLLWFPVPLSRNIANCLLLCSGVNSERLMLTCLGCCFGLFAAWCVRVLSEHRGSMRHRRLARTGNSSHFMHSALTVL
jgi:hypothetical protein